jgi:hypothetical protein
MGQMLKGDANHPLSPIGGEGVVKNWLSGVEVHTWERVIKALGQTRACGDYELPPRKLTLGRWSLILLVTTHSINGA